MSAIALSAALLGARSYWTDQKLLSEARDLARLDLLRELEPFPLNYTVILPKSGRSNCVRRTFLDFYVSQICYEIGEKYAVGEQIKLYIVYQQPMSRTFQLLYQSNEVYFSALELGEVVVRVYGNGGVRRFGSAK